MKSALSGWAKRRFSILNVTAAAGICALVIQPVAAVPVHAATENVTQLNYITAEQTIGVDDVSTELRVQSQNTDGAAEQLGISGGRLIVTSDSLTGEFSSNGEDGWASGGDFNFNVNYTSRGFYYRDATPGIHTLTAHIQDAGGVTYDWQAMQQMTVTAPEPILEIEEFVAVNNEQYKGVNVAFRLQYFSEVSDVIVEITREDGSLVTKYGNAGAREVASQSGTLQQLAAHFVIQEGDFTEADDSFYWQPAPATWTEETRPASVKVTVIDENGEVSVVNEQFLDDSGYPPYESLLPEISEEIEPELPEEPAPTYPGDNKGTGGGQGAMSQNNNTATKEDDETPTNETAGYEGDWIGPGVIGAGGFAYLYDEPQPESEDPSDDATQTDKNEQKMEDDESPAECSQWFGACWYWWMIGIVTLGGVAFALWRGRASWR